MWVYIKCISKKSISKIESTNYFGDLIKAKKSEIKNILIDEKNYKDLVIYFTRYVHKKSIKTFYLYYNELIGNITEHEEKNI